MNKIFKVIFSKAKGCYVVVSELAKSAGKGTSASHIQRGYSLTLAAAVLSMMMGMAPVGAVELGGGAAIAYDNTKGNLTIGDAQTVAEGANKNGKYNTTIGTQTDTLRNVTEGNTKKEGQPLDDDSNTVLVDGEGKAHDLNKSTEAGGSTAVGYYNHNEGDRSTTIGNNAKISNKPVTYYVDADGNKIASPDNAAWYKDASGNPTKVPQVFRDANGNTTATPQYRHTYTEKDPTTGEDVTKTEITSDAGKADKDSGGNPVYNYIKEDNKDKLYSVTLYQAASNSIAAGTDVTANGSNAVAVGYNSKADNSAVAIGDTTAAVENGVAIGKGTKASAEGSIALGKGSEADRDGGIAGWDPKTGTASTKSDVAWKSGEGALSIGNGGASRQITNVAAGSEDSDAVNLAQLKNAMTHYYSVKTTAETDGKGNNNYLNDGATGDNALAVGVSAVATGDNATAVGYNTSASGSDAAAFGSGSKVTDGGVAVGNSATASGNGASFGTTGVNASSGGLAVGISGTTASDRGVAVGLGVNASSGGMAVGMYGTNASSSSAAFGLNSTTATNSSVAVGANGTTANNSSFAAGFTSKAGTNSSSYGTNIAVGSNTMADNGSSAFGINATANNRSLAIGLNGDSSSSASAINQSIAIGNNAQAGKSDYDDKGNYVYGKNDVALGNGAFARFQETTAIGYSAIANDSYATAIGSSAQATDTYATAVGNGAKANKSGATALGYSASATHDYSTAVGDGAGAHGTSATALGNGAAANSSYDTAIGSGAVAGGGDATALGYDAKAQAPNATALGSSAEASFHAVAIGDATASSSYALAAGDGANAQEYQAIALGYNAQSKVTGGVALGSSSTANVASGKTGLDPHTGAASTNTGTTWVSTLGAVSVGTVDSDGNATGTRQINGLAAGTNDTDAVNVAQLKAMETRINMHYYSVNSTLSGDGSNYDNTGASGTNALAAGPMASARGENAVAIGYGAKAEGRSATAIGKNASATGQYAMAFGGLDTTDKKNGNPVTMTNTASGASATAFGQGAQAKGNASLAFGHNTVAGVDGGSGQQSVAFGEDTQALGGRSLAFGEKTIAKYNDSVAFGNDTRASSTGATAFGNRTRAISSYSTAWGNATVAADEESTAWGSDTIAGAKLDENGAVTNNYKINPDDKNEPVKQEQMDVHGNLAYIQPNGKTAGIKQMPIDSGTEKHDYVVLAGKDGNTYVRDYQGSLWKVNVAADGTVTVDTTAGKNGKVYNGKNGAKESLAKTTVKDAEVAITPDNVLTKAHEGSNGYNIDGYANATAFGYSTEASGDNATAFGNDTKASATGATAFGYQTLASGENSTAFGENSIAAAKNSLAALGGTVAESATNAAAIGNGAQAKLADSVALGSGALANRSGGSKGYDVLTGNATTEISAAWVANANAIAIGNDTEGSLLTRQITGVAAGSQDTDAVNVAQLKAAGFKVTTQNDGSISSSILNGDTLDFEGKDNAIVSTSKDSKTITVAVSKTPTFDSATFGTTNNEKVTIANGQVSAYNDQQQKRAVVGVDNQGNGTLFLVNDDLSQAHLYTQSSKETGNDGITRMYYTSSTDDNGGEVNGVHTIAVLDDGINYAGDNVKPNTSEKVVVKHKLNSTMDITGGADTNNLAKGNIGVVATPAVEDEQGNITQKGKLELKLNKDLTGLNTVTAGTAKIGSAPADTLKLTENGAVTEKTAPAGSYVTGLDNKYWDVSSPTYVSGRAATEDQLKKVSDAVNKTAAQHTIVTVNDNKDNQDTKAAAGKGTFGEYAGADKGNLLIAAKDDNGQMTYNIKLNDQLAIGQKGEPGVAGKDGKDGKVTVETKGGTTVVIGHDSEPGKDGKDGLFVTGKDGADGKSGVFITGPDGVAGKDGVDGKVGIAGKDGKDAVSITGKDGVGHIGLTGPKGEKGADGTPGRDGISIDILTDYGTKTLDSNKNVTVDNKEQASRIIYNDAKGPHEVATMDDGLKIGANAAAKEKTANPVSNKLNSTINIKGSNAKADHTYTDDNLTTTVEQDADGNTTVKVLMDQDITGNSVTVGKDSKDGEDGKAGYDGQEGSIGIAGKNGIDGKNGKQGITTTIIKTEKGQNGKDGEVGKQGAPGVDGKDITRIVYQNGQDGENGQGGKHVVATLDDGLKFVGDDGTATPVTKKLNDTLQIRGDGTYDATTKTNSGNIQTSVEDGTIKVALNDKINLHQDGSLTVGGDKNGDAANGQDPIVIKHFDDKTLDMITGVDKDGKPTTSKEGKAGDYVTGLDNKDWNVSSPTYVSGRAATEDQLKKVSDAVNSAAATAGKHTVVTVNDKDSNETKAEAGTGVFGDYAGADKGNLLIAAKNGNGQMTYNIKLNDQLAIGQKGEPGVAGKDGKVTVETKGGTTVVIGHDGEPGKDGRDGLFVTGKDGADGKSGVSITGPNGVAGTDGVDGKVGIAGKDGKDAVSIAGKGGVGHIGLTGPKGEKGKDGISIDITTDLKSATLDDGKNVKTVIKDKDGKDTTITQAPRIQYDSNGKSYEVATMDDGQKYAGDFGKGASVKLNKTVTIKGNVAAGKTKDDFVDGNIAVVVNKSQNGEDGELLIKLNKDLTGLNSATYTTSTKNGDVTTTVVDGTGLKIDNGPSITNTGINGGKHQITNVASGKEGKMYDTTVKGQENWNNAANIGDVTNIAKSAADGVQAKSGKNITVDDNNKVNLNDHITLGDAANKAKQVDIDGNGAKITAGDGDNKVTVDGSKGQIVAGSDNGVKIGNITEGDSSLTIYDKDGKATNQTDKAGKYVTNLDNKTWKDGGSYVSGRAATEDQLHQVESNVNKQIADVNTKIDKVDKHHTEVTVNGGTPAKADGSYTDGNLQLKQTAGKDGQKVYDLKLNDQLKVGQKGDAGKAGKDGNVTVETKGGTTVVIGHDGKDGKDGRDGLFVNGKDGKDGKSGVSITGPNGVAGRDGVDGKVGIAGKDGKDAVSIAGKDGVGHIGLTGPKGADGKDGTNIDISTVLGKSTLDRNQNEVKGEDKDGTKDQAARIQYQTTVKEADGTTKTITHEVATMDDGMKYGDDFGNTAKVKLNHQLDIVGDINAGKKDGDKKATKDDLSDGNIGIVATDTVYNDDGTVKENGKMTVKLAKDLKGLNSIESNSVTTGNTTINNGGLTIKTGDANRTITVQDGNVNMGGNQIHHVAPGQAPDDAVNVSQLNATNYAVNKLDTRVNRVGANAAALAALHPLDFDPDDKWDFSAGYGHYKDANAAAVGAFYRPNEDTMFSVGGSFGGGENMVNAGVSVKLGQGNHVSTSRVAMAKEIKDLKKDVAALKAVVNQQSALIDKLTGVNAGELSGSDDLFPDVPANHWAYEYVTRLKQAGILTGYPDGNFAGDRMMTRYEFAAIVYRAIMAGAAANPSLNKDGTLDRLAKEFSSEMKYIRIDTIRKDRNGRPTIQRVRVIKEDEKEK
ncbi:MAG TPA: ESPR-type extended signal peptide-containing protein [Veillonellaceae bacterium]|nr:ESPR-type extended signal peptide-containing protein [Veillonellaceae bacterium]